MPPLLQVRAPIAATESDDLVTAVTAELAAASLDCSFLGVAAIALARQMSGPVYSGRLSRRCQESCAPRWRWRSGTFRQRPTNWTS